MLAKLLRNFSGNLCDQQITSEWVNKNVCVGGGGGACTHAHTRVRTHRCTCVSVIVCMHVHYCMCACVCHCTCTCHVCVCHCIIMCLCVNVCMPTYRCTHAYRHTVHRNAFKQVYTCVCLCMCTPSPETDTCSLTQLLLSQNWQTDPHFPNGLYVSYNSRQFLILSVAQKKKS